MSDWKQINGKMYNFDNIVMVEQITNVKASFIRLTTTSGHTLDVDGDAKAMYFSLRNDLLDSMND